MACKLASPPALGLAFGPALAFGLAPAGRSAGATPLDVAASEAAFEGVHERIVKGAAVLEELRIPAKKVDVTVEACGLLWVSDSEAPPP
jgi:hypothetical protein